MRGKWPRPFPWPSTLPALELHANPRRRWLDLHWQQGAPAKALIHCDDRGMGKRLQTVLRVAGGLANLLRPRFTDGGLRIQLHDEDPGIACLRLDAPANACVDPSRPLIPDPYCLMTQGYLGLRQQMQRQPLPPWEQRLPVAFWRGASTGSRDIRMESLAFNRRYQLCLKTLEIPEILDARLNRVVQGRDAAAELEVEEHLQAQGLFSATVNPWHAALHAWQIDIDGNVNSWGLLWKLLSGSCILRVESSRQQWFHHRLKPWVHVVPVRADLSDLAERLAWCRSQRRQCAAIATAGQALAREVVDEIEDDLITSGVRYAQAWMEAAAGRDGTG